MMAPAHADVFKWEHLPFPKSLPQFQKLFPTDHECARYLEGARCVSQSWQHRKH